MAELNRNFDNAGGDWIQIDVAILRDQGAV